MTDEEIVYALMEAVETSNIDLNIRAIATALLPVVRRVAEQRAAEELLVAADRFDRLYRDGEAEWSGQPHSHAKSCALGRNIAYRRAAIQLRARAVALTATPNHGTDATT